jgi:hypothetical protein
MRGTEEQPSTIRRETCDYRILISTKGLNHRGHRGYGGTVSLQIPFYWRASLKDAEVGQLNHGNVSNVASYAGMRDDAKRCAGNSRQPSGKTFQDADCRGIQATASGSDRASGKSFEPQDTRGKTTPGFRRLRDLMIFRVTGTNVLIADGGTQLRGLERLRCMGPRGQEYPRYTRTTRAKTFALHGITRARAPAPHNYG